MAKDLEKAKNNLVAKIHLAARRGVLNKESGVTTKKRILHLMETEDLSGGESTEDLKKEIKSLKASKAALTKANNDLKAKVESKSPAKAPVKDEKQD